MAYQRGDIVLVPIPYTDLSRVVVRPGVVLTAAEYEDATGDVTVAMVTTQRHDLISDYQLLDWQQAGLIAQSWVRARLATLDVRLIRFSPGSLSTRDLDEVRFRVRSVLGFA